MEKTVLSLLGDAYQELGNTELARECYRNCVEIAEKTRDLEAKNMHYSNLQSHLLMEAILIKESSMQQALTIMEQTSDPETVTMAASVALVG